MEEDSEVRHNCGVVYLSIEGMLRAFERAGLQRQSLCTYCIGGEHPFK